MSAFTYIHKGLLFTNSIAARSMNSYTTMNEAGLYSLPELFGKKWDAEDPLATDDFNQNLLAWFGFEETLRNLAQNFECLEEII